MRANAIGVVPAASAARRPSCWDSPPPGAMLAKMTRGLSSSTASVAPGTVARVRR